MESICTEHQPNHFFMGAVEYPFWEQGQPWEGYIEPRQPVFSDPFEDASAESSFDGAMVWTDTCEQLYYMRGSVSPTTLSPPVAAPELINPKPTETIQTQPSETSTVAKNPGTSTKRKRRQPQSVAKSTHAGDSRLKRPCLSRSTSFSSSTVDPLSHSKDDKAKNKEDMYLERSRVASNRFRERKRNEIAQLESEEYTIEDANRQLHSILDALTSEILSLKMQLLQHTNCNCELIQAYINKEAHHFVKSLQGVAKW
ncbi:transcription factor atf21, partial [Metarhizium majus ARSEF 297]